MLTSMTGFGRAEVPLASVGRAIVEIRTLNHRFLEIETRLPEGFQSFNATRSVDESIRAMASKAFRRGRVRISLGVRSNGTSAPVVFESALARRYVSQLMRMKRELKLPGTVTLEMVLGLPQVVTLSRPEVEWAKVWPQVRSGIGRALADASRMRRREGARLAKQLTQLVKTLDLLNRKIRQRVPVVERLLKKRLADRIQLASRESSSGKGVERSVALAETASFVQATDVREELDRVASHLTALRQAIGGEVTRPSLAGSPGRTIDFLAQELHREVNTLGSKMRDAQIVRWGIAMKGQIEKLREQAANVE